MYDQNVVIERLVGVVEALERIPRRFVGIRSPGDFLSSEQGQDKFDAICMILIVVGEAIKRIDNATEGLLFSRYSEVEWRGVIGVRDIIAHGYFDVDVEQVYEICLKDIPLMIDTLKKIINDLKGVDAS